MSSPYDALIFDCDGVLVEPTDTGVLVDAVIDAFDAFGVTVDRTVARRTVVKDVVPLEIARDHDIDPEAFWHYRELRASLAQQTHVRDGGKAVYDDVAELTAVDLPTAIVSNNQHATIEFLCAHHELPSFDTVIGRRPTLEGAAERKPKPDNIERAISHLGVQHALYVGDSQKDVVAAQRAGIDAAFVRRPHVRDVTLSVEPTHDLADLSALVDRLSLTPNRS